jgi:hypothetical protein
MRASLFFLGLLVSAMCGHAQGTVVFSNAGTQQPLYVCDENSVFLAPVGSTFQVGLYYAPDGTVDELQFVQLGNATGFTVLPGYFSGGVREAPTEIPGDYAMFQVRGWETAHAMRKLL